jgi:hypothetical protein
MSLLLDIFSWVFPWVGLIIPMWVLWTTHRKRNKMITPLERRKFKQLQKDISTIKKSQPKSRYQSQKLLNDIFEYMPTRSWYFDGHSEFGKDQAEYHWSAPALRAGKRMTVTIAWNTKYSYINYIATNVRDDKPTLTPGSLPSEIDAKREPQK